MKKIRIGSRDSRLAILQTQLIMQAIQEKCPQLELELVTMKTTGDRILHKTLDQIGGKGLFVKELDQALMEGRVDLTVHSCKDLPMELPEELPIVALSKREDPRDVLVLPEGAVSEQAPYGTASKRRALQLAVMEPDADIRPVRGNVVTRLKKLDQGEYRGLILAAAGLKRMGLEYRIDRYYTTEEMVPAACQGILAVQGRAGEDYSFLEEINAKESWGMYNAERSFVQTLNGGCSSPVAAYAEYTDSGELCLTGFYVDEVTGRLRKGRINGSEQEAVELGRRLARLLSAEEQG